MQAAVLAAADAFRAGDEDRYARRLAGLGLDGRAPGERPLRTLVGQVIEQVADQALALVWERGWQPADVERLVARRLRAGHGQAVVAAIAHQHRRYAAATVAPHWRAQLRAMGADPWSPAPSAEAPPGALPLGDLYTAESERDDYRAMIEVLSVLWWLPKLPRLGPLPGEARGSVGDGRAVDGRMLERVRALLAKAESTTFTEEAEAFTAKAQELMARHAVDRAMVEGVDRGDGPGGRRIGIDDPYAQAKSLLLAVVADANRCRSVWSKDMGFSTVFGHESDLDGVDLLYTSLLVQATAAMAAEGRRTDRSGRSRTRSFRSSFLVAYAQRIGQRLRESTDAAEAAGAEEHGAGLLPVLAARSQAVDDAVGSTFPEMGKYSVSASNGAGWAAGTAAAELARLSPHEEVHAGRAS
ncbi:MAG: DUF2786 domain-containing protein [Acidimicrobiia bacterium]|nr:DUF2786 domain-containing protein [Acidimicrobiia bacterium]